METSKLRRLLEIIFADGTSREIEKIRNEICCGCKVYNQDCLMMTEQEGWQIHGLKAIERISKQTQVLNRFMDVLKILDEKMEYEFAKHLTWLQTKPDQDFIEDLLQLYENNHELLTIINNLFNPPEKPLESYSECFFSYPPSFKHFIKETQEHFISREGDYHKAYHDYMKNKLRKHVNELM